jgi:two-component system CheB/CheR fusion protein
LIIKLNPKPKLCVLIFKTADDIMLSKYSPCGVVINEAMDIVQFQALVALEQSSGKPSHNLLVMAKNGLAFELRNIIHKTKKGKQTEKVPVEINGRSILPLKPFP